MAFDWESLKAGDRIQYTRILEGRKPVDCAERVSCLEAERVHPKTGRVTPAGVCFLDVVMNGIGMESFNTYDDLRRREAEGWYTGVKIA